MERWLLTYADMITLLLALFVVLFALSSLNVKKFIAFDLGLTQTFSSSPAQNQSSNNGSGLLDHTSLVSRIGVQKAQPTEKITTTNQQAMATLDQILAQVNQALQAQGLSQAASASVVTHSVVVQVLADKAYFANDSATLGTVGDRVVDTVAGVIRSYPNHVEVQGFTDDVPVTGGQYDSNWELSAARAANVVQRLATSDGIPATRLSAAGYGDTHPVASNATPAGRAQNRRVDMVILAAGATAAGATGTQATGAAAGGSTGTGAGAAGPASTGLSPTGSLPTGSLPTTTPTTASPAGTVQASGTGAR